MAQMKEGRKRRHEAKHGPQEEKESLPERLLGRGSMRITFRRQLAAVPARRSFFVALDKISKLDWPTATTALARPPSFLISDSSSSACPWAPAADATRRAVVRSRG